MSKRKTFDEIWEQIIEKSIEYALSDMDQEFTDCCDVEHREFEHLKPLVEKEYKEKRHLMKLECYSSAKKDDCLDSRKLGALICGALIHSKCVVFDEKKAFKLSNEKKKKLSIEEYNEWAAKNLFVNYKIAYFASWQLVFVSTVYCLLNNRDMFENDIELTAKARYGQLLSKNKGFFPYPKWQNFDSFGVNMIVDLARADMNGRDLDLILYSMMLWQIEMYSLLYLQKIELAEYNKELQQEITLLKKAQEKP